MCTCSAQFFSLFLIVFLKDRDDFIPSNLIWGSCQFYFLLDVFADFFLYTCFDVIVEVEDTLVGLSHVEEVLDKSWDTYFQDAFEEVVNEVKSFVAYGTSSEVDAVDYF